MANNGVQFTTSQLTQIPLGDWSRSEYLYIQLQSELLLAVACLPTAPRRSIDDASQYIGYCQYFATPDAATNDSPDEAGSGVVKSINAFMDKRDKLSGSVMWALRQMSLKEIQNTDTSGFRSVQISPAMLQGYRQIRERLGFNIYMYDPKLWPELWSFLQDAARNQFPEFSGDATQAESTRVAGASAEVDMDMDSTPIIEPVSANALADTSGHDSADEDEMSDAEDDVNPGATRPGPDDFARETGTFRCTRYMLSNGERCRRRAATENEDRRSWLCHNHDPVEKKILADRLAGNKAAKAVK
jgi:hypothetical protein